MEKGEEGVGKGKEGVGKGEEGEEGAGNLSLERGEGMQETEP